MLNREQNKLQCQLYQLANNVAAPIIKDLPNDINLSNWNHIAIQQKEEKIALLINFQIVAEFQQ